MMKSGLRELIDYFKNIALGNQKMNLASWVFRLKYPRLKFRNELYAPQ